ncbi:prephenate dehydrogenase [Bacillus suaedaesalsae]|uniref:Prephenate dehydrogenase n=1 Tax=Bacillus suaedaesalsae TaxID=2810349 RepID=A0ABS2DMZ2_9BACI|nr:prephenate dehydrogenase [Bacillus suaedaesalsae]MBM6619853.1 prephenate dehydrogenase [Bacillus suaedaesalsae]
MKKKVLLIGLGLIGGSIGLAIRRNQDVLISGYDIKVEQARLAKSLHVIDEIAEDYLVEATSADFIIISTPVSQTEKIIHEFSKLQLRTGVVISDVGSTKSQIVEASTCLYQEKVYFIGGHPMAGSHKSGVGSSKAHLFENAFYILTPTEHTPRAYVESLKELLSGTKANFIEMTAREHDEIAGLISHFPHIIAASLVHNVAGYVNERHNISRLAAGGFRDITRIASSNPAMWRDILIHNREQLLAMFDAWKVEMDHVKEMIESLNETSIYHYFESAKAFRDGLPQKAKGAIPAFYDLFVDVPDYPGVISEVTGVLAIQEISITNIRIIEAREDIYGVLRLSFQTEEDREEARRCLEDENYETYISS